ncbi:hypothetical protein PL11201_520056 [Planktothrix sp. PCC 11201]|nr:hypothetical protein PL11201_520056 [Planktothrix sp. PCC 11201]
MHHLSVESTDDCPIHVLSLVEMGKSMALIRIPIAYRIIYYAKFERKKRTCYRHCQ